MSNIGHQVFVCLTFKIQQKFPKDAICRASTPFPKTESSPLNKEWTHYNIIFSFGGFCVFFYTSQKTVNPSLALFIHKNIQLKENQILHLKNIYLLPQQSFFVTINGTGVPFLNLFQSSQQVLLLIMFYTMTMVESTYMGKNKSDVFPVAEHCYQFRFRTKIIV